MTSVANRCHQIGGCLRLVPLIPALSRPELNQVPVLSELGAPIKVSHTGAFEPSDPNQKIQIMRIARIDPLLVWKLEPLGSLRNACLERALDRIPSQVIRPIGHPDFKERLRLSESNPR